MTNPTFERPLLVARRLYYLGPSWGGGGRRRCGGGLRWGPCGGRADQGTGWRGGGGLGGGVAEMGQAHRGMRRKPQRGGGVAAWVGLRGKNELRAWPNAALRHHARVGFSPQGRRSGRVRESGFSPGDSCRAHRLRRRGDPRSPVAEINGTKRKRATAGRPYVKSLHR